MRATAYLHLFARGASSQGVVRQTDRVRSVPELPVRIHGSASHMLRSFAEIFGLNGFFQVGRCGQPVRAAPKPEPTIHRRLPDAITFDPELQLTCRLRLYEAYHFLFNSIPPCRVMILHAFEYDIRSP
ncbi:hypothetical protein PIB30_040037 [Stylosanthes scabra]|uniref:Uncharacterized protein n=1 Tax=Stylosanthes scabra TaxID=79078 RepID=A0ABU6SEU5_9FABA|nr:hypothetical protein [Stylosanthes scabra]